MEGFIFIIVCIALWISYMRIGDVKSDLLDLRRRLDDLEDNVLPNYKTDEEENEQDVTNSEKQYDQIYNEPGPETEQVSKHIPVIKEESISHTVSRIEQKDYLGDLQHTFEKHIATKLPVWIGSISLICAAFFLVKYSLDADLLTDPVRAVMGLFFGSAMLYAGQWVSKRPHIANGLYISQGLIGAGIVSLYFISYAATQLWELIPPFMGFGAMAATTFLAVLFALRHGQAIAVFALLGGLITPALISTEAPSAILLFSYLFVLFSGLLSVMAHKKWWVLAILTLLGMFAWSGFWFFVRFNTADAFVLILFAMALSGAVLSITSRYISQKKPDDQDSKFIHGLNLAAIIGGVITIIVLSTKVTLTLFDWSMLGLLTIAVMALSYFKPHIYQKSLWLEFASTLVLLFFWALKADLNEIYVVLIGLAVIYIGGSGLLMRKTSDPRPWALLQAGSAVALYLISYLTISTVVKDFESLKQVWGAIGLSGAVLSILRIKYIPQQFNVDGDTRDYLTAIYTLTTSAFIALGFVFLLPFMYLPLAIAGQIFTTALVYSRTNIASLKKAIFILSVVFIGLNFTQILLFADLILTSMLNDGENIFISNSLIIEMPLLNLGVPMLLFAGALWTLLKAGCNSKKLNNILFITSGLLGLATFYYIFREFTFDGSRNIFRTPATFTERGFITIFMMVYAIGLMVVTRYLNVDYLNKWGTLLFRASVIRFIYFDIFLYNPFFTKGQFVGDWPVLNGLTLTYGFIPALIIFALFNKDFILNSEVKRRLYKTVAGLSYFMLVTFSVRQLFHGGNISYHAATTASELYTYSLIWLLMGIGFLTAGIKYQIKSARMISLAFMLLTIGKVFLIDAAALDGLFRVFSFFGLGISLIGLSYFYTKFVFDKSSK